MPAVSLPPLPVPLRIDTVPVRGETHFLIWSDNTGRFVKHARAPGFWSATADGNVAEVAEKRRLSDTTAPATTWYRLAFPTWPAAREYATRREKEGYGSYLGDVDRYETRVLVEDPDFFRGFPMTRPLRILAVDIEQRTDGKGFPPRDAPIVSIAFGWCDGKEPRVVRASTGPNGEPDDAPCLVAWAAALKEGDPDVIVGFNVGYDLGVLAARAGPVGFPLEDWGRVDENGELDGSYVRRVKKGKFHDDVYFIGGRVVWDLRDNANAQSDYNLSGCKDFKLKTIAAFLGLPVVSANTNDTLTLWRNHGADLERYNANDVLLVEYLVARYLPDRVRMADFFGAPLDMTIDVKSGWPGTIAAARTLYACGIVSDGTNFNRHRAYLKVVTSEDGAEDEAEQFAGAHTAIYKHGRFAPVFKVDFASLYPNILIALGAGPDNTRIVGTGPLGDFAATREGDTLCLSVPDENYGHNWLIEVRGRSSLADMMAARMAERLAAKKAGDVTRANILKTLLNAMFGVQGSLHNRYGVLPVAIITTGVARVLINAVERCVVESAIEVDTDGIYLTRRHPVALLQRAANREAERFGFAPRFELDLEEYAAGWFHEAKAYLLLTRKGQLKRFGVAFKGRHHPAIFDRIIERVGGALLRDGREAALSEAKRCLDFTTYNPRDFVQRVTYQPPYEHNTKELKVAEAHLRILGTPLTLGRSYEYVRTHEGMVPPTADNLARLDEHAYLTRVVLPALDRLGFADQSELGVEQTVKRARAKTKADARASRAGTASLASYF